MTSTNNGRQVLIAFAKTSKPQRCFAAFLTFVDLAGMWIVGWCVVHRQRAAIRSTGLTIRGGVVRCVSQDDARTVLLAVEVEAKATSTGTATILASGSDGLVVDERVFIG